MLSFHSKLYSLCILFRLIWKRKYRWIRKRWVLSERKVSCISHWCIGVLSLIFIVLAHWNNSLPVDMSLHSNTLFWFRANQSLLFLLNAACLAEKQQIPILLSLVLSDWDSNPRSTTLEASPLTLCHRCGLKIQDINTKY